MSGGLWEVSNKHENEDKEKKHYPKYFGHLTFINRNSNQKNYFCFKLLRVPGSQTELWNEM